VDLVLYDKAPWPKTETECLASALTESIERILLQSSKRPHIPAFSCTVSAHGFASEAAELIIAGYRRRYACKERQIYQDVQNKYGNRHDPQNPKAIAGCCCLQTELELIEYPVYPFDLLSNERLLVKNVIKCAQKEPSLAKYSDERLVCVSDCGGNPNIGVSAVPSRIQSMLKQV
jgi:hypothetical protein